MRVDDFDKIVDMWSKHLLIGYLDGYTLEIEDDVPKDFAALALYLDSATVKASGEAIDFYEGYKRAASDVLNLIGVEMAQDDEMKLIIMRRAPIKEDKEEELKQHIWG